MQDFAKLKSGPELPLPPPSGTLGEHILLRTNLLPTNFDVKVYYDYELKFEPTKGLAAERKDQVLELVEGHTAFAAYAGRVAHDGRQRLLSVSKLPEPFVVNVKLPKQGDQQPLDVSVEFVLKHELDMDVLRR